MKQINPLFDIRWHKENHFRPAFAFDCDILLLCYNRRVLVIFITETENDKNPFNVLVVPCSSCPEVFFKDGVLENFSKFTGKHQWQCLFLNKVASLRPATSLKKRLWHWCFPANFARCSRTTFYRTHPVASSVKIKNSSNHWKIWDRESCKQKQLPNSLMESKYTILLPKAMNHQLLPHI